MNNDDITADRRNKQTRRYIDSQNKYYLTFDKSSGEKEVFVLSNVYKEEEEVKESSHL